MNSSFLPGTRKLSLLDLPGRERGQRFGYCVLSRDSFGCEAVIQPFLAAPLS